MRRGPTCINHPCVYPSNRPGLYLSLSISSFSSKSSLGVSQLLWYRWRSIFTHYGWDIDCYAFYWVLEVLTWVTVVYQVVKVAYTICWPGTWWKSTTRESFACLGPLHKVWVTWGLDWGWKQWRNQPSLTCWLDWATVASTFQICASFRNTFRRYNRYKDANWDLKNCLNLLEKWIG